MELIDNQNRSVLAEGRNYGFSMAFCKVLSDNQLETISPITACKDFLNDILYTEKTQKKIGVYGLHTSYSGIFKDENYFYMVGKVLPTKYGGNYATYDRDKEFALGNKDGLLSFINQFEDKLKIDLTEILECENDKEIVIFKVPIEWANSPYMISLYGLIVRIGLWYKYEDLEKYLNNFTYDNRDLFNAKNLLASIEKLKKIVNIYKPYDYNILNNITPNTIHNFGIQSFLYKPTFYLKSLK